MSAQDLRAGVSTNGTDYGSQSAIAAGIGGAGTSNAITGTAEVYGSGGGGGGGSTVVFLLNMVGGTNARPGGRGTVGYDAVANFGGGGGGGSGGGGSSAGAQTGGAGGSGVVVVRYLTGAMTASGGTVTTSGAYTVHRFTASGSLVINP